MPRAARARFEAGRVMLGPSDWEAQGVVEPREVRAGPFALDRFEIHVGRYLACLAEGRCPGPAPEGDPGEAALLGFEQASALCAVSAGRLPSDDEWTLAAMGARGRRYPWGDTGAVCRRAAFGLVDGPCAAGAEGPDTVGAHPDGQSPEGLFDLAGNAAEWTLSADGSRRVRGGSFASSLATDLRGWRSEGAPPGRAVAGARCAYDVPR